MLGHWDNERWVAAAGDSLELFARAFADPSAEVASALSCGTLQADALACAEDLGVSEEVGDALSALQKFEGADEAELLASLRRAHSVLYLVPASKKRIFPYEGAFRFEADEKPGNPLVFSNRAAADMEQTVREAGLKIDESRHEPADSIWFELAYLSYLYGLLYRRQAEGADGSSEIDRIVAFQAEHGRSWMVDFMAATACRAPEVEGAEVYRGLALLGGVLLRAIFEEEE